MKKNPGKSGIDIITDAAQSGRDAIDEFLALPFERPAGGILRCSVTGVIIGILLLLDSGLTAISTWPRISGLLVTGLSIAFTGWGAERLWYSMLGRMFLRPLKWYAYLTRLPFWFIAGGIGYILGLLASENYGWLSVQDIPVRSLFITGGYYGMMMQIFMQIRIYLFFRRYHISIQTETERSSDDQD